MRNAFVELLKPGAFGRLFDEEKAGAAAILRQLDGFLQALEDKVLLKLKGSK